MNYTQYYEKQITEKIDQEERKLWQEFYTKRLPKRTEKFKRKYTGKPEELQKAIEEFETRTAGEYSEVIDEKLTIICGDMREKFYHEILAKLDQLSAGMPDKADSPKLDNQTIASEIITDQKAEIEKLKAELQKLKNENLDEINRDKENAMFEIGDCINKLKWLIDKFIEHYGFYNTKKMSRDDALAFAYNKENMCQELFIMYDYACKTQQTFEKLDEMGK